MRNDSIVIKVDASGKSYATMAYNELSKNHQNVLTDKAHDEKQSMMMEQPQRCPVQSLRLYMSKLNDRCDAFWQRPNEKYEGRNWYANRPVGVNKLADMMKVISQEAHLSCTYTNHCLRATSCTVLSDGGIHARHICKLTGHRNESSVAVYARTTPIEKRWEMSNFLHSYGAPQAESYALVQPAQQSPRQLWPRRQLLWCLQSLLLQLSVLQLWMPRLLRMPRRLSWVPSPTAGHVATSCLEPTSMGP